MSETVVEKAAEMMGPEEEVPEETPEEAEEPSEEAPEAPEAPGAVVEFDLEPELTDEQKELLEEPDFEAEAEAELRARQPEEYEEEYEEPSDTERRAILAEKRAEWLEQQRLRENRGRWEAEAKKVAPAAEPFLDTIEQTTRKGFIREAKQIHDRVAPWVKTNFSEPVKAREEALQARIAELEREIEEHAWGKPTGGPSKVPTRATELERRVTQERNARQTKDLGSKVYDMIYGGEEGA